MSSLLQNLADIKAASAGIGTASIGLTVSLTGIQTVLGVVAAICGIVLTIATFFWRYRENRLRESYLKAMKENVQKVDDDE